MTREAIILAALVVGVIDLIVCRMRGGLRWHRSVELRRLSQNIWRTGGEVIGMGLLLTPNIFVGVIRSRRRMRPVRMRH